ncbi:MAG: hypothetical protein BWZ02_02636 [Lentisphaerae bacterium ADurb.BinA184]|nr:MAG: hypothetical protein BWZ02_02636 [Lentisphaerae bacterium ADurb.BinA184]
MEKIIKKNFLKKLEYQWGGGICDVLQINGQNIPAIDLEREFQKNEKGRPYAHTYYRSRSGASGAGNFWYSPVTTEAKIACQLYQSWGTFIYDFRSETTISKFAIKLEHTFEVYHITKNENGVTIALPHENPEGSCESFADGMSCDIRRGQYVPRWLARAVAYEIVSTGEKPVWETETVAGGRFAAMKSPCGFIKFHASNRFVVEKHLIPLLYGFGVETENENFHGDHPLPRRRKKARWHRRQDGTPQWTFMRAGTPTSPVIAADRVVVGVDGVLCVVDAADGALIESVALADRITSPALVGGRVVVGTDDGFVIALGAED